MSIFKNPFEKLSAENQEATKTSMMEVRDYLVDAGKNTIVQGLNIIATKIDVLIKHTESISKFLGSGKIQKDNQIDEKKLKAVGVTTKLMGEGMKVIVEAMKVFSKIPDKVVDKFVLAIEKIASAFKKIAPMAEVMAKSGQILMQLAKGIILFGLAMIVALPIYIMALPGTIVASAVIMGFVYLFAKVLGSKDMADAVYKGAKALALIGIAVILFGIAMLVVGAGVYMKLIDITTIVIFGIIIGFMLLFAWGLGKVFREGIYDGAKALAFMGIAIILFGLALLVAIPLYKFIFEQEGALEGLGLIGLVMLGAVAIFFLLSLAGPKVLDGAKALVYMALSIILLGLALWTFNKLIADIPNPWETMAMIGVALGGLAVVLIIVGLAKGNVIKGAVALMLAVVPIFLLALAFKLWKKSNITWEDLAIVGAAITGLGVVMGVAGIPVIAAAIAIGSGAMILAGLALITIGYGFKQFKKVDWKEKDSRALTGAFSSLTSAMLGGEMPGGFFAALKFAAMAAARALLIYVTAPAFILAGFALQSIGKGLKYFKNTGFSASDGENMESVFASIIKAFTLITDDERKKKYGINASWFDVMLGTIALQGVGNIMTEIAMGVKSMANLNFIEYEVVRDKNGNTKIQPKAIRKLTDGEIQMAGVNFARIIDVMINPMVKVGKAEKDSSGWFSGGYFSSGVRALTGSGRIMKDLATGVRAMANLKFIEYEVFIDKDGKSRIQPKSITTLTDADMVKAGHSFGLITDAMFKPIVRIGKAEKDSSGIFSSGYFKTGVQSLTGVGKIMSTMATGVKRLANGTFIEYEIFTDKNGKTKIQPKAIIALSDNDMTNAGIKFGLIVDALFGPISKVGKAEKNSEGWFADGMFKTGVSSLTGVGKIMSSMAKGVKALALGEFHSKEVSTNPKTGKAVVKTTEIIKISPAHYKAAGVNFKLIVDAIFGGIVHAATMYNENRENILNFLRGWWGMNKMTTSMVKLAAEWSKIQNPDLAGRSINSFIKAIIANFSKTGPLGNARSNNIFNLFSKRIGFLIMNQSQFEKVADSFERMAESMGTMKDNINALELDRLKEVVRLFGFMDSLGKSDKTEDLVSKIGDVLKEGIENLQEILEKIAGTTVNTTTNTTNVSPISAAAGAAAKPGQPQTPANLQPLLTALGDINRTLQGGITVTSSTSIFDKE